MRTRTDACRKMTAALMAFRPVSKLRDSMGSAASGATRSFKSMLLRNSFVCSATTGSVIFFPLTGKTSSWERARMPSGSCHKYCSPYLTARQRGRDPMLGIESSPELKMFNSVSVSGERWLNTSWPSMTVVVQAASVQQSVCACLLLHHNILHASTQSLY